MKFGKGNFMTKNAPYIIVLCVLFVVFNKYAFNSTQISLVDNMVDSIVQSKPKPKTSSSITTTTTSTTTTTAADSAINIDNVIFKNKPCTGKPRERRELASLGSSTTESQWKEMGKCIANREKNLAGIFGLHVSKAGGSSFCRMFKTKPRCFRPAKGHERENCWMRSQGIKHIPFGAFWIRDDKFSEHENALPQWMSYDESNTPTASWDDVLTYLDKYDQLVVFDESFLPKSGKLSEDLSNVMVFREPISRIISHFQHMYNECDSKRSKDCQMMLRQPINEKGPNYFNVTYLEDWFDLISDNYYTRSLNNQRGFKQTEALVNSKNGKELFTNALENLRDFDWVIILASGNYTQDGINRQKIIEDGLGLYGMEMLHSRARKDMNGEAGTITLHPDDYDQLIKRNKFDIELWEEARKLHTLDVSSLERLKKMQVERVMDSEKCCGFVCKP